MATAPPEPAWLLRHRSDTYSQAGEDGVIEQLLRILPRTDRWCVEFGAWDGTYLSNTRRLIEEAGYSAVLIEPEKGAYDALRRNNVGRPEVITINAFVGFTEADGLDAILAPHPVPQDFDLLSIDVDGNDYHIWKAISRYRPKVICVEFNPTIPTDVRFVQAADPAVKHGSSLLSLVELAKEKGYDLVSVLPFNAFFVDAAYSALFNISDNRPEVLRKDLSAITYLFSGLDGTILLEGSRSLPWHGLPLSEKRIQHLPAWLRRYPNDYTPLQRIGYEWMFASRRRALGLMAAWPWQAVSRLSRTMFGATPR